MKVKKIRKSEANVDALLAYIKDYFLQKGYAPNVREMGEALSFSSTSTVVYYLKKLEDRGLIKRDKNKNRAIEYLGEGSQEIRNQFNMVRLPLLGNIAGGAPLLAEENTIETFSVSQNLFGTTQDLFSLKVIGDSMIEVGIDNGDTIVVKIQNTAENGEIVVARTNQGTTVKKFYKEANCFRLQPQNMSHLPIIVNEVEILGKVIAVIKKFK